MTEINDCELARQVQNNGQNKEQTKEDKDKELRQLELDIKSSFYIGDRGLVGHLLNKYFNIPKTLTCWKITDTVNDLVLIHYDEKFDPENPEHEPIKQVRGIVFDLNTHQLVAKSNGYVDSILINSPISEKDGVLCVGEKKFDGGKLLLGYESFFIRVFKHNNKVYFSTNKKIDGSKSYWRQKELFKDIFDNLSGFNIEDLFGEEEYSPYCYNFVVQSQSVALSTNVTDEKLVYVGYTKMWEDGTYKTKVEPQLVNPDLFKNNENLIEQKPITVELANKVLYPLKYASIDNENLKQGEMCYLYKDNDVVDVLFNNVGKDPTTDERTHGGEFVVIKHEGRIYKIVSQAYKFRNKVTDNNSEPYNRYFMVMISIYRKQHAELETYPEYNFPDKDKLTKEEQLICLWNSVFYEPISHKYKERVKGFYDKFYKDLDMMTKFLMDLDKINTELINNNFYKNTNEVKRIYSYNYSKFIAPVIKKYEKGDKLEMEKELKIQRMCAEQSIHNYVLYNLNNVYAILSKIRFMVEKVTNPNSQKIVKK